MYNVMIIDDEELIREGLKSIIDWESLNLNVSQLAENGFDAFEKFEKNPVDIIITDINMPLLDGISLLKKLREINNKVRFIILSGYEKFEYAQEAISIGVQCYLLKPIDEQLLMHNLKIITKTLDDEKRESLLVKKDNTLKNILNGIRVTEEEFAEMENMLNISVTDKNFVVATLVIKGEFEQIAFDNINMEYLYDDFRNILLINSFDETDTYDDIKNYYNGILDYIKRTYNYEGFIAIGKIVDELESLNDSFKTSYVVKREILKTGFNNCLCIEDVKIMELDFKEELKEINKIVAESNQEVLTKYMEDIFKANKNNSQYIYLFAIKILIIFDDLNKNYNTGNVGQSITKVLNFTDIDEIKNYLIEKANFILQNIEQETEKLSPIIKRVLKYINKNYARDLSLKVLATEYNINASYLGQIFSKEVGVSFSEYLNTVRNSIAKDLILNTNKKMNDISKEVGFVDTSYFYRKFKKYYGVTPSTLRVLQER